ncbi:MAG: putative LPS assembly protein LptD [Muribaculaceae bacterium]
MNKINKYLFVAALSALAASAIVPKPARAFSVMVEPEAIAQPVAEPDDSVIDLNRLIGNNAELPERIFTEPTVTPDTVQEVVPDSTRVTVATDSIAIAPKPKSRFVTEMVDLDNIVNFKAKDSLVIQGKNNAFMYGESDVTYGDINLKANEIHMEMNSSEVYAVGVPDSTGELQGNPVFKDKSGEYKSKSMRYNFKSEKGLIKDVITEQGEGYLTGGITKMMNKEEYFIKNGRYTTCDDHDEPHFYMNITKGKVKPKKNIVTGPAYMVLEGVPLPLAVPFGYFPFTSSYSSGIIMPTFGEDYNYGFFLRDGGYYLALNNNMDLALTGQIYTKGSWGLTAQSNYLKRYKFSGAFNVSYIENVSGDKGSADYMKQKNFKVSWSHSQDSKSNPNMTFSASVNFTTSGYTRADQMSYYSQDFTENTKSSTVNMTYKIPNSKWSFSTTANISQRTSDSTLTVSFPNLTITMSQMAPFKRKRAVGAERWYEKIKISYSGLFQNSLTSPQNQFFKKSLVKDWRNGMKHSIPVSATFNVFKYFNITPSISMTDRMYTNKIRRQWDPAASAEVRDTTYNFYNVFDFSASVSMDTKIYGFYRPLKVFGDKVKMIRHVITPSLSFSGSPDFSSKMWGYYGTYSYPGANGEMMERKYSYFQHGMFGSPGSGKNSSLSFSMSNNLEMKVKSNNDSIDEKKISLIENLTVSQSYNFAADSLRWSNINTSILLRLTKNFNLNMSATWDPYTYALNSSGNPVRVNRTRLQAGKGFAKLSSTGTSFSYTINNNTFKRNKDSKNNNKDKDNNSRADSREDMLNGSNNTIDDGKEKGHSDNFVLNPDGYAQWECPWSLSINYSVNYSYGTFNYKKMDYNGRFTQNLSFSGNIKPTKNWSFNFSTSYNFDTHKLSYMNCSVTRDLHCFSMSGSFVPVGPYKSYTFHIAVKSSLLSDLKYDKRSSSSNGVSWY